MTNKELQEALAAQLAANKQLASQFQQQQAAFEELRNSVSTKPAANKPKPSEETHSVTIVDLPNYKVLASRDLGANEKIILEASIKKGLSFIHGGLLLTNLNSFTAKKEGDTTIRYNRTSRGYFAKAS
jgi:hypothetical protein